MSYASEDRPAVRALRDALAAAGLEVWYDENELTGGDAWDRKIRRQIRECTYFMPIISATTNARAEGYFRREWRMGVERTQDMADDVIYLLPVTIDEVDESAARVPEQFLRVQWMHAPGGQPTPALNGLCRRLLGGGTHQMHKPASTAPRATATRSTPPIRTAEADAHEDNDLAPPVGKEWWFWLRKVWRKMPRWVRFCLWGVLVLSALNTCTRCSTGGDRDEARARKAAAVVSALSNNQGGFDHATVKQAVQNALVAAAQVRTEGEAAAKSADLDLLPFAGIGSGSSIQSDLFGKLITTSGIRTELEVMPLKAETPLEHGKKVGVRLVLSGAPVKLSETEEVMRVTLTQISDGAEVWSTDVKADENTLAASARIYTGVLPFLLKRD